MGKDHEVQESFPLPPSPAIYSVSDRLGLLGGGDVFPVIDTHAPVSEATWTGPLRLGVFSLG